MQVSDHVRQVVDSIAERVRMATYEASAYRTQRERVENIANGNFSSTEWYQQQQQQQNLSQARQFHSDYHSYWNDSYNNNNTNNNNDPHLLSVQNNQQQHNSPTSPHNNQQQQRPGEARTSLFSSPAPNVLTAAQTKLNSNRKEIVDYAMKRVASVPPSTRVSHHQSTKEGKQSHQASVFQRLYGQNSEKLTYQMAQQSIRNTNSIMNENNNNNNNNDCGLGLPPRSPIPASNMNRNYNNDEDDEQPLDETQRPSTAAFNNRNGGGGTVITTSIGRSSSSPGGNRVKTRHFVGATSSSSYSNQQQRYLSPKHINPALYSTATTMIPSRRAASSSISRNNQNQASGRDTINQRLVDDMLFGVHRHKVNRPSSSSAVGAAAAVVSPTRVANSFVVSSNARNKNNNNDDDEARNKSPESAYGLRTEAPTATSTKIFVASDYDSNNRQNNNHSPTKLGQQSAIKNTRNIDGFVEYNPEYEHFRNNVQTSLRVASRTTRFLDDEDEDQ